MVLGGSTLLWARWHEPWESWAYKIRYFKKINMDVNKNEQIVFVSSCLSGAETPISTKATTLDLLAWHGQRLCDV